MDAESERDQLREDLKKAKGMRLTWRLFFFPCRRVEFRLTALWIFAESADRAGVERADAMSQAKDLELQLEALRT